MNKDSFWIFTSLGLGDGIVQNALFRHYADKHNDKIVILPAWEHNISALQWMLSDVPNIFFYPIETEQQLLACMDSIPRSEKLCLGFYETKDDVIARVLNLPINLDMLKSQCTFNPVLWDSEFYRQAGLDPELKWKGFKIPNIVIEAEDSPPARFIVCHQDEERGFKFREEIMPSKPFFLSKDLNLKTSCKCLALATEIHCIDSSMLNIADLMETPYCKRFVFHRYARKGLPPQLKKQWEILD